MEEYNPRPTEANELLKVTLGIFESQKLAPITLLCIDTNDEDYSLEQGFLELHRLYRQKAALRFMTNREHVVLVELPIFAYDLMRFIPTYISLN